MNSKVSKDISTLCGEKKKSNILQSKGEKAKPNNKFSINLVIMQHYISYFSFLK